MKHTISIIAIIGVAALTVLAEEKPSVIKDVMKSANKAPKGEDPLCKKVVTGKATDAEKGQLLEYYKKLIGTEPPRGDLADWKQRTEALVAAADSVVKNEPDSTAKLKTALDCKACHKEHKPEEKKPDAPKPDAAKPPQ
jgi:cytochrome c553